MRDGLVVMREVSDDRLVDYGKEGVKFIQQNIYWRQQS
jgi:hypothetical protein